MEQTPEQLISTIEAALAALKSGKFVPPSDVVTLPPPGTAPILQPYSPEGMKALGYIVDGVFIKDFWMKGRPGAMVGASEKEYNEAAVLLSVLGSARPRESYVMAPDDPAKGWNENLTTSGTIGWNPRGLTYFYDEKLSDGENYARWIASGCPMRNQFGEWSQNGRNPKERDDSWKRWAERKRNGRK